MIFRKGNIYLSKGKNKFKNTLYFDRVHYLIENLNENFPKSRGGNSSVFRLIDPNTEKEYAVKFSRFPIGESAMDNVRFEREITALKKAKDHNLEHVIKIIFDSEKKIDGKRFRFYVMEKADSDLRTFIIDNEIGLDQKILLCYDIVRGIQELHSIDVYHRDIKPDNIFFITKGAKSRWKIGDLGLMIYRDEDLKKEEFQRKIGPVGWMSPEAMNKVLCEGTKYEMVNDCIIDEQSDTFQLGKVFWYIFQYCVPIGQVELGDFSDENQELFDSITSMIQYKKNRRSDLEFYREKFMKLAS